MTVDLSAFERQLETYIAVSSKSNAEALNKKLIDLCKTAAGEIHKISQATIRQELLRDPHLLAALTSLHLKAEGKGKLKSPEFKAEMRDKLLSRMGGVNYLRSGWAPAVEALGGTFRGKASERGLLGYAEKATGGHLTATAVHVTEQPNAAKQESAENVVNEALQRAADKQVDDMEIYIARKLSEVWE